MPSKSSLAINIAALLLILAPLAAQAQSKSWSWRYHFAGACTTNIAVGPDNIIYAGAVDGATRYLYAFRPEGALAWRVEVPNIRGVSVTPDNVILCSKYRTVAALNSRGEQIWESEQTELPISTPPAVDPDGTIVVANAY
ncbi:MAG: hypothetical protein AB7D57_10865, partial [Desulfovibrionaceae bacterium]